MVGNALKFTKEGSIEVHSWERDGKWILETRDTGRGMKPEEIATIFQAFTQAQAGDLIEGWGLGLSIVKGLVDQHSGNIEVDSQPGFGTAFRVIIPIP
ncbi:HAMP domain-containing sensor histidine kinase [Geothrix sp. PMB-07]|uniref:sensor histidine kinase n=1 Tax=Geothrix sp. PMB-07 TaxID=3068640 RepID=UPI00274296C5|nr:ATP-binding protein [Geothrix sp. PMB-07]WLT30918.1 ATP-binding protein [Geothrix sp. PMB-07]